MAENPNDRLDTSSLPRATEEEDISLVNEVFRQYFPSPFDFHCDEVCRKKYLERRQEFDKQVFKENGWKWEDRFRLFSDEDSNIAEATKDTPSDNVAGTSKAATTKEKPIGTKSGKNEKTFVGKKKGLEKAASPKKQVPKAKATKEIRESKKQQQEKAVIKETVIRNKDDEVDLPGSPEKRVDTPPFVSYDQRPYYPFYQRNWNNRKSQFTADEHKKYVAMMCNFKATGKYLYRENAREFKLMSEKLKAETDKFNEYIAQSVQTTIVEANEHCPKHIRNYITRCMKKKAEMVRHLPSKYTSGRTFYVSMPMHDPPTLEFKKRVSSVGQAPRILLPNLEHKYLVPMDDVDKVDKVFPVDCKGADGLINADPNIPLLLSNHEPDFIASTSALRCLLTWCGPHLTSKCEIPVIVEYAYVQGRRHKIVYLSKPLPPRVMSQRQQMGVMAKYAVKAKLSAPKFDVNKAREYSQKRKSEMKTADAEVFGDYNPDVVESAVGTSGAASSKFDNSTPQKLRMNDSSFGIGYEPSMPGFNTWVDDDGATTDTGGTMSDTGESRARYNLRKRGSGNAMTDVEEANQVAETRLTRSRSTSIPKSPKSVVDKTNQSTEMRRRRSGSILKTPSSAVGASSKQRLRPQASKSPLEDTGDVLGGILSTMSVPKKSVGFQRGAIAVNRGDSTDLEDTRAYNEPLKTGVMRQYLMWSLKDYQILTRSNVDGVMNSEDRSTWSANASLSAKVEYQPAFGGEEQTEDEILYENLTGFLKQSDLHYRVRVKFDSQHDVLMCDKLTKESLRPASLNGAPLQMCATGMRRLHVVLGELKNLDEGTYMLEIKSAEGDRYSIYSAISNPEWNADSDDRSVAIADLDMEKWYNGNDWLRLPDQKLTFSDCWRRIDPEALLQWHRLMKRIPTSFPPRKANETPMLDGKSKKWKSKKFKGKAAAKGGAGAENTGRPLNESYDGSLDSPGETDE